MSFRGNLTGNLAYQNHAKGEFEQAKTLYKAAISQGVNKPRIIDGYGVLLMRFGEFEEAIEMFAQAIKLKPEKSMRFQIRTHRAIAYMKTGDMERARVALEDINSKEELQTVYETLGYFYVITDDEKAHSYNEQAVNLYPESPIILDNIAQYYIKKGHPEIAREFVAEAYEIDSEKVDINFHYAQVEQATGNMEKALEYANQALECKISALNDTKKEDIEKLISQLS